MTQFVSKRIAPFRGLCYDVPMQTNQSFRQYLQEELSQRAEKNPAYSIRSFAKAVNVEASSLAQILGGKRPLTDKMCLRVGAKLGLSPLKVRALMNSRDLKANDQFAKFNKLSDDAFRVIADWHYYAILELTQIKGFKGDVKWIAKTLDLPFSKVLQAIDRLKRLQYLEITEQNKWIDRLGDANNLGNEFKTQAFSEHQKQILEKAAEALIKINYEDRVQSSMTLVSSRERVRLAKPLILNFIEELDAFLKAGRDKDDVVAISVSLFPLTETKSGE